MKEPVKFPLLDAALDLSEKVSELEHKLRKLNGRVPLIVGLTNKEYEHIFETNTTHGTSVLGWEWLSKTKSVIRVAEDFNLDISIPSNRAFLSSLILAISE